MLGAKGHMLHGPVYTKCPELSDPWREILGSQGWGRGKPAAADGCGVSFRGDGSVLELVVMLAQLRDYARNRRIAYFKKVNILCGFKKNVFKRLIK